MMVIGPTAAFAQDDAADVEVDAANVSFLTSADFDIVEVDPADVSLRVLPLPDIRKVRPELVEVRVYSGMQWY
jgi:hypothetical protein